MITLTLPQLGLAPPNDGRQTMTYLGAPFMATHVLSVPLEAFDTGLRSGIRELWLVANDPKSAYVVDGNDVQRWPSFDVATCSA